LAWPSNTSAKAVNHPTTLAFPASSLKVSRKLSLSASTRIISAHERAYSQQQHGGGGQMDAQSMGAAAAMQAMKSFTGGGGNVQQGSGGNMQSKVRTIFRRLR
jgi:hypothetical protein